MEVPYTNEKELKKHLNKLGLLTPSITKAISIVSKLFKNKKRDDGSSYLRQHIFPVTMNTADFFILKGDKREELIISALFHDVFEDSNYSLKDLKKDFPTLHKKILNIIDTH